jgi:hypothetical protein
LGHPLRRQIRMRVRSVGVFVWGGTLPTKGTQTALPVVSGRVPREGREAHGGAVFTVGANAVEVESRLEKGELACPDCGGSLGPWGWARPRVLRGGTEPGAGASAAGPV